MAIGVVPQGRLLIAGWHSMGLLDILKLRRERRRWPRHAVVQTAWLQSEHDRIPIVCVLWNVSHGGAMLALSSPHTLPDIVQIALSRDDKIGTTCRVAWRGDGQIGVEFVANAEPIRKLISQTQDASRNLFRPLLALASRMPSI